VDANGLHYIAKNFSWPYGFPSHSSPATPGVILEGGELGYALSVSYGAVLDNPDLIVACMIGDGEAETGSTATAWHINKFINPITSGFVLPILHLNGYKISGPTIYGRMSNHELQELFHGYGYEPIFIECGEGEDDTNIHERMIKAMDIVRHSISDIREKAGKIDNKGLYVHYPMIILRTPKGWTGIKTIKGEKLEGNALSHQVIAPNAKEDVEERKLLEQWLKSYKFEELFDAKSGFREEVKSILPKEGNRIGENRQCYGGNSVCIDLFTPNRELFMNEKIIRGESLASNMKVVGEYLREVFRTNAINKNFRLFSPDETYSNKLDAVFEVTKRATMRRIEPWDKDLSRDGRVIEMLSEHSLQGLIQGYILTGRHGVFASYEAFLQIISSMADQYIKFIRVASEIPWRGKVSSLNYILTSPGWRQEHNGFSHQNPGFIDAMLEKHGCFVHVYFPADRNTTIITLEKCLSSRNQVNLIVAGKSMEPEWLTPAEAKTTVDRGLMTWDFASDPDPDIVLCAIGDYLIFETMAALDIIKKSAPEIKIRFVNITELSAIGIGNTECNITFYDFNKYFTEDKPVIFNFHGYPETMKQALFDHQVGNRKFSVHGYMEIGSTTTPFDMHVRNKTSRYHIASETYEIMAEKGILNKDKAKDLIETINKKLEEHKVSIYQNGVDMKDIADWKWTRNS